MWISYITVTLLNLSCVNKAAHICFSVYLLITERETGAFFRLLQRHVSECMALAKAEIFEEAIKPSVHQRQ